MIRYRVLDLPTVGTGAFTPIAAHDPLSSSWGLVHRYGAPGNLAVAVDNPHRYLPNLTADDPRVSPSNVSPDVIRPSLYVASARNMGPQADAGIGMRTRRHTPLPIPALSWVLSARNAMRRPKIGGREVQDNPRAFQRWPSLSHRRSRQR